MNIDVYIFVTGSPGALQCAYSAMKTVDDLNGAQMFNGVNNGDGVRVFNQTDRPITVKAFGDERAIHPGDSYDFQANTSGVPVASKGESSVYLSTLFQKTDDGQTDVPIGQILVLGPIKPSAETID